MKPLRFIAFVVMLLPAQLLYLPAVAGAWVTKEKKLNRHFTVQPADILTVNNKFGDVRIKTWDKNEITVDITISAKSKSENKSQEILDHVSIDEPDENGRHDISFKTVITEAYTICCNNEVKIDYVINAPRKSAIDIKNKFGDVFVDDFEGKMDMDVSYGGLSTQRISGKDKQIKVAFGSARIAYIETGILDISFSKLTIDNAQDINVSNKFGKSTINVVHDLDIKQRYGDLEIGTVSKIEGSVEYAGMNIDKLNKSADMTMKYCGKANFGSIGPGVDFLMIKASYGSVHCSLEEDANLSIDVKVAYGDVKNLLSSRSASLVQTKSGAYNSTQTYNGKAGAGEGKMDVNIKYGSFTIK